MATARMERVTKSGKLCKPGKYHVMVEEVIVGRSNLRH